MLLCLVIFGVKGSVNRVETALGILNSLKLELKKLTDLTAEGIA